MSEPTNELREWVREIKEALGQQFSNVHRELKSVDDKVVDGIDLIRNLEERVRKLELNDARRDGHRLGYGGGSNPTPHSSSTSSPDLSVNYKMIGAIISGAVGGLYVLYDLISKHGGK